MAEYGIDSFKELETPCFIFDKSEFQRSVNGFKTALRERMVCWGFSISVKTITVPAILKMARLEGCMAEVVSYDEYNLAKSCGYRPSEIIYNGPLKSEETFRDALLNGAVVNIETKRELEWLKCMPSDRLYEVGLRLSINISRTSPEDAADDNDFSRFGFSDDAEEFKYAVDFIRSLPNVRLAGLHIHKIAHNRSPRVYARNIDFAARIIQKYNLELDYLDVGGGFFGIFSGKPTYDEYSCAIAESIKHNGLDRLKIYVEPGNAILASSFSFLTSVIDVKCTEKMEIATIDGSRNDVDPLFHKSDYLKKVLYADLGRVVKTSQLIGGCTCMEADRLFVLHNSPALRENDRVLFFNVGAYTITLSPQFIRFWPKIYCYEDGRYTIIRNASSPGYIMKSCDLY